MPNLRVIKSSGYIDSIRSKLGVKPSELPDSVINDVSVIGMAEVKVIKRLPNYANITDDIELMLLEGAVINYACAILCRTMPNRIKTEVSTLDVKWKKAKVDWEQLAKGFIEEAEEQLYELDMDGYDATIFMVAKASSEEEA